jgi:hypothetical protein
VDVRRRPDQRRTRPRTADSPGREGHLGQLRRQVPPGLGVEAIGPPVDGLRGADPGGLVAPVSEQAIDGLKFSECLPRDLAARVVRARLADAKEVSEMLDRATRTVVAGSAQDTRRPAG